MGFIKYKVNRPKAVVRKRFLLVLGVFGVALIVVMVLVNPQSNNVDIDPQNVLSNTAPEKPNFDVLQSEQSATDEIYFDPEEGVASYTSSIDDVSIAITQQPLTTEQLNDDTEWLKNIAFSIEAETVFQTRYGDTYLAQPSELTGEAQVVVFKTDQLLLTIRTNGDKVSLLSWADYINSVSN